MSLLPIMVDQKRLLIGLETLPHVDAGINSRGDWLLNCDMQQKADGLSFLGRFAASIGLIS